MQLKYKQDDILEISILEWAILHSSWGSTPLSRLADMRKNFTNCRLASVVGIDPEVRRRGEER